MDTPRDAYEEAIEKMAKARMQDEWDSNGPCRKGCYNEAACDCLFVEMTRQRAAAEAIGLREMMEAYRLRTEDVITLGQLAGEGMSLAEEALKSRAPDYLGDAWAERARKLARGARPNPPQP
jgi:hypothetical protein